MAFLLNFTRKFKTNENSSTEEDKNESKKAKKHINNVYNLQQDSFRQASSAKLLTSDKKKHDQFELILEQSIVDLELLKNIAWQGVPDIYRGKVWKLLLKYVPPNHQSQNNIVSKKRQDYKQYIHNYYKSIQEHERDENEKKIIKIIQADVLRTQPQCQLFRYKRIQMILERLLFIWNMRHPSSGYVQGINDIASPLISVFLAEYIPVDLKQFTLPEKIDDLSDDIFEQVEADTYWCLSKILDNILDYYTTSQPGVTKALQRIRQLISCISPELDKLLVDNQIELTHFAFRWVYCLLVREFPLTLAMRILDTYISDEEGFAQLHIYTCTNLLLKCYPFIKNKNSNDMILFFQNLPTKEWSETQIEMLLAEAYVFKTHYEKTSGHIKEVTNNNNSFM